MIWQEIMNCRKTRLGTGEDAALGLKPVARIYKDIPSERCESINVVQQIKIKLLITGDD